MINKAEKILKSKIRTKQGLVGYVNNLFKEIDKVYATFDIGKLDLLSSYKDIIEHKLVKMLNFWEEINDNIKDEEEFQNKHSQSLQFEEQVKFQLKQLKNLLLKTKKFLSLIK